MNYTRFGLMILTSTAVMFVLMYLNTYAWEHVFFSETRLYMAFLMGATMAFVMLAFMRGMYPSRNANIAIFAGSALVFGTSLWLVRSQATVSGTSYMQAMIPHHSIAVMTSERARIHDPRVRRLADEIIQAQLREIAEMRYLIAEIDAGRGPRRVYQDPPARLGSIDDALDTTLVSNLDPAPLPASEADLVLDVSGACRFRRSPNTDPILWISADETVGAMKLNGVIVALRGGGDGRSFSDQGASMTIRRLHEGAGWRPNAELVFALDAGLTIGYQGFHGCDDAHAASSGADPL